MYREVNENSHYFERELKKANAELEYNREGYLDMLIELNKEKEKNKRNKAITIEKLKKLLNGVENDFPISLGEQQPLWQSNRNEYIKKDKLLKLLDEDEEIKK